MMFWEKVKLTASVLGGTLVLAAAVPVTMHAASAGQKPAVRPAAGAPAPAPAPAPAAVAKDTSVKAEWRGKLLVQLAAKASRPLWSPDGKYVAFCLALKQEPGRGYTKTTEGGVGVIELATGSLRKVSVSRTGPVTDLLWAPDGKSLFAAAHGKMWNLSLDGKLLKIKPFADLAGKLNVRPGRGALCPSPDGKYLLCRLQDQRRGREDNKVLVLDATSGRRLSSLACSDAVWGPTGRKLYYSRDRKLRCLELPGGRETVLLSSGDYFKGAPPKTHANWLWSPRPVAAFKDGKLLIEIIEAPDPKRQRAAGPRAVGIVVIKGQMLLWKPGGQRGTFTKMFDTKHGLHGETTLTPLGREGLFLLARTTAGFNQGKLTMQVLKASTNKVQLKLSPPPTARYKGQEVKLSYGLRGVSPQGDTVVFSVRGRYRKALDPQGKRFVSYGHWFGLSLLEVAAGTFRRLELPLHRDPRNLAGSPNNDLLALEGSLRAKDSKTYGGVWLCNPDGKDVVKTEARKPLTRSKTPHKTRPKGRTF